MRKLLVLALLALVPFATNSCRGHHGRSGAPGADGVPGTNGDPGTAGAPGQTAHPVPGALAFDYLREIDGSLICTGVLVINADRVVPPDILAFAPPEDPKKGGGLILSIGPADSLLRFYLDYVKAGELCVTEKIEGEDWVAIGDPLVFAKDGFLALVPINTLTTMMLDQSIIDSGVLVEFTEPGECKKIELKSSHLKLGRDLRINFPGRK